MKFCSEFGWFCVSLILGFSSITLPAQADTFEWTDSVGGVFSDGSN